MSKILIVDSSPLIVLLKSNLENILLDLFDEILLPDAVWNEILNGQDDDIAKRKLPSLTCVKRVSNPNVNPLTENYNLGKGETAVINVALENIGSIVILDDSAARKCAKALNVTFIGTGGLLILAKRKGLIPSVSEALEKVRSEGLWLSDKIVEMLKQKAGE